MLCPSVGSFGCQQSYVDGGGLPGGTESNLRGDRWSGGKKVQDELMVDGGTGKQSQIRVQLRPVRRLDSTCV